MGGSRRMILWWRKSLSGWVTTLSLFPYDDKRDSDPCSWWRQHKVVSWFWVWILLQGSTELDSCMGTVYGIYPWVSTLVMGNLMWTLFWVVCGWLFLGGQGKGKRKYWTVGVSMYHDSDHYERCPRSSMSWADMCAVQVTSFDNSTTSSKYWRQWMVSYTSFPHGLHGTVGMVSYTHEVYVTCYFCYMFRV